MEKGTFYDQVGLNPVHYRKKKDGKHEFGLEVEAIIPSTDEICLLGNRNRQCKFYQIGVELCHTQMLAQNSDNFLACKEPIDGMWRCYTEEKYGTTIRDSPAYTKYHEK